MTVLSIADANWLREVLRDRRAGIYDTVPVTADGPNPEMVRVFEDIYNASSRLWNDSGGVIKRDTRPAMLSRTQDGIAMDGIGGLIGMYLAGGYGSILGAAIASILYFQEPPGGGGWDCSDYCNMA